MFLHLFGTSRLHEELKLRPATVRARVHCNQNHRWPQCGSNRLSRYPVHYKFWTLMDEALLKCFNNHMDRRILAICRRSQCLMQLLTPVRKNANGIFVQQISIQAPSLDALERCCSILDDVFPQFNASITLRGRGSSDTTTTESRMEELGMEEATATISRMPSVPAEGVVIGMAMEQNRGNSKYTRYRGVPKSSATFTSPTTTLHHCCPTRQRSKENLIGYIISEKGNEHRAAAKVY
ncbi:unnamed protein product [Hydatigera taeniaeformis]|uniref:IMS_C domain-containing protein n=1 Tax=Hydatigena taeniaeformis TaxID=6205 RepID=A0A0R3XAZ9_HYDTA|nr:unnamed protein product [Hydatigera taeniaeformis]